MPNHALYLSLHNGCSQYCPVYSGGHTQVLLLVIHEPPFWQGQAGLERKERTVLEEYITCKVYIGLIQQDGTHTHTHNGHQCCKGHHSCRHRAVEEPPWLACTVHKGMLCCSLIVCGTPTCELLAILACHTRGTDTASRVSVTGGVVEAVIVSTGGKEGWGAEIGIMDNVS